jgi:hypothetical protein
MDLLTRINEVLKTLFKLGVTGSTASALHVFRPLGEIGEITGLIAGEILVPSGLVSGILTLPSKRSILIVDNVASLLGRLRPLLHHLVELKYLVSHAVLKREDMLLTVAQIINTDGDTSFTIDGKIIITGMDAKSSRRLRLGNKKLSINLHGTIGKTDFVHTITFHNTESCSRIICRTFLSKNNRNKNQQTERESHFKIQ